MTHDHLLIIAIALLVILLVCVLITMLGVDERLTRVDRRLEELQPRPLPNVGGRMPPSPVELAAARNRMDAFGIAHAGSATGQEKG